MLITVADFLVLACSPAWLTSSSGGPGRLNLPASDVLQLHLQEKYQYQGECNGYKHQHPSGKYEGSLSHNTPVPLSPGDTDKKKPVCIQPEWIY